MTERQEDVYLPGKSVVGGGWLRSCPLLLSAEEYEGVLGVGALLRGGEDQGLFGGAGGYENLLGDGGLADRRMTQPVGVRLARADPVIAPQCGELR